MKQAANLVCLHLASLLEALGALLLLVVARTPVDRRIFAVSQYPVLEQPDQIKIVQTHEPLPVLRLGRARAGHGVCGQVLVVDLLMRKLHTGGGQ